MKNKNIIFTIKTAYTEESFFMTANNTTSLDLQIEAVLSEIGFCDEYEIIDYKEVDNDYYIKRLATKTAYETLFNESLEDAFCSGKYTTLKVIKNEIEQRTNNN